MTDDIASHENLTLTSLQTQVDSALRVLTELEGRSPYVDSSYGGDLVFFRDCLYTLASLPAAELSRASKSAGRHSDLVLELVERVRRFRLSLELKRMQEANTQIRSCIALVAEELSWAQRSQTAQFSSGQLRSIELSLQNISAINAAKVASDSIAVSKTLESNEETLGKNAESELAKEFGTFADKRRNNSLAWLIATVAAVAVTVLLGRSLLSPEILNASWKALAGHLTVILPVVGIGAYSARESSRHREASRWAAQLAVQLKSISAYADRLDEVEKNMLLSKFGQYVFGPHSKDGDDNQLQAIPPELISALINLAKSRKNA